MQVYNSTMKNLTVITLNQSNITDFASARNLELAKAKTKWVLFLDSDETMSHELEKEIESAIQADQFDAYLIPRLDTFLGRELRHGEPGHTRLIRLAKADFGRWVRPVHEVWQGRGRVGHLKAPILHHSHTTIASFLDKINNYSSLDAKYRYQSGVHSNLFKIGIYPFAKFVWNYIFLLGFLDGVPGIIMAIMMSFHSYLTWTKLYLLWHKK